MSFKIESVKKLGSNLNDTQREKYNNQTGVRRMTNMNYGSVVLLTDEDFDGRPCGA